MSWAAPTKCSIDPFVGKLVQDFDSGSLSDSHLLVERDSRRVATPHIIYKGTPERSGVLQSYFNDPPEPPEAPPEHSGVAKICSGVNLRSSFTLLPELFYSSSGSPPEALRKPPEHIRHLSGGTRS